jgi:CheY-like chemotaxis protein
VFKPFFIPIFFILYESAFYNPFILRIHAIPLPIKVVMHFYQQAHLLLIDDDEDDYTILEEVISSFFPLVTVSFVQDSGRLNRALFLNVSIVLLDVKMANRDGFECIDIIRNEFGLKRLPIVIYSDSDKVRDIIMAYQRGANLFVNKPFSIKDTIKTLDKILTTDWSDLNRATEENLRLYKKNKH